MLLVCVHLGELPLLCKPKQANLTQTTSFLINTAYSAMYKAVLQDCSTSVAVYGFDDISEKDLYTHTCLALITW